MSWRIRGAAIEEAVTRADAAAAELDAIADGEQCGRITSNVARGVPSTLGVVAALDRLLSDCTTDIASSADEIVVACTAVSAARAAYDSAQADMATSTETAWPETAAMLAPRE